MYSITKSISQQHLIYSISGVVEEFQFFSSFLFAGCWNWNGLEGNMEDAQDHLFGGCWVVELSLYSVLVGEVEMRTQLRYIRFSLHLSGCE